MGDGASFPYARKERFDANTKEDRRACREKFYSKSSVVVVVLRLTHRYNGVRGHMTGSNNSGSEQFLKKNTNKNTR